jgi:lysophospholipase L1-like esterase
MNKTINNANKEIQKLSDSYNYTFLNLNHYFLNKSKYLNPELASDNVHLNDKGYFKLTGLLKDNTLIQ